MAAGRNGEDVRGPGAPAWALLGRLWGYAILVGVVAMLAGTALGAVSGSGELRLVSAVVVAGAAGWWSPNVIRFVRRLAVRAR